MKDTPPGCIKCSQGVLVLNQEFALYWNHKNVGFVRLSKKGMFYSLNCRFRPDKVEKYHLVMQCDGTEWDLGICVPFGRALGMERHFPIHRIGEGEMRFVVQSAEEVEGFAPIYDDQPFLSLGDLLNGRFAVINGVKGIVFARESENITPQQCNG
jgi:hypothetical protein